MKGIVLYQEKDYAQNRSFVDWLQAEFSRQGVGLDLALKEKIYRDRLDFSPYAFAINRTRDYNLSLALELNQIRVFNSSQISLLGNNKLAAYAYAQKKGYPIAPLVLPGQRPVHTKVIAKPIDGHGGAGIRLIEPDSQGQAGEICQVFLEDAIGDVRFYIINNQIYKGVLRKRPPGKILSNFSQGGQVEPYFYSGQEEAYVYGLLEGLDLDYGGVDFLLMPEGDLIFNEIEDVVGSRMLSHLGDNQTVPLWVGHICRQMV